MKRKSARKSSRREEENSNELENNDQNGDASDHEVEEPKDKKRKPSKGGRKNVSFIKKDDETGPSEDGTSDNDHEDEIKEDKKFKGSKRISKKETDPLANSDDETDENDKKKPTKKGKKSKEKKNESIEESAEEVDEDDETQYEVEAILDEKLIRGIKHYLIRWKGYEEESDTWEPEDTLDCKELMNEFKKKKKDNKGKPKSAKKKEKKDVTEPDWDENEDFEVERILEVHFKKSGKREFLVSWKGFPASENSWEPEENMDCKDLIERFMDKVKTAKQFEERELRQNRKQVQRYTLNTPDKGRRLSKRNSGKERVQYHDAE